MHTICVWCNSGYKQHSKSCMTITSIEYIRVPVPHFVQVLGNYFPNDQICIHAASAQWMLKKSYPRRGFSISGHNNMWSLKDRCELAETQKWIFNQPLNTTGLWKIEYWTRRQRDETSCNCTWTRRIVEYWAPKWGWWLRNNPNCRIQHILTEFILPRWPPPPRWS